MNKDDLLIYAAGVVLSLLIWYGEQAKGSEWEHPMCYEDSRSRYCIDDVLPPMFKHGQPYLIVIDRGVTNISRNAIAKLKQLEGFKHNVYICSGGYETIGYGHRVKRNESYTWISRQQAHTLLMQDLRETEARVLQLLDAPVNQAQFDALVLFTYNVGVGALERSTLLKLVNEKRFDAAAREFSKWIHAKGKPLPGLKKRRNIEKRMFAALKH